MALLKLNTRVALYPVAIARDHLVHLMARNSRRLEREFLRCHQLDGFNFQY